jgi:hypothetical protein
MKAGRQPEILGRRAVTASEKQKPRWLWTGVMPLDGMEDDSRLRELVAMLPARKSSDWEILAYLVDLGARFRRWMHQDEFGPDRGEQTAALRALMKSCRTLQKHLLQRSSTFKSPLDATLRARSNPNSLVLEAFYEAAGDVAQKWRSNGASHRDTVWIAQLQDRVYALMAQSQALDTNTGSELFLTAAMRKFDLSQITGLDFCLADAECWLNSYVAIVFETLNGLNTRRGPSERVSLKFLVELLCELWERETGNRVTVPAQVKDEQTYRAEIDASRFVTAAVEAMLPDKSWFDEHADRAQRFRTEIFLPDEGALTHGKAARSRQVIGFMRDFVKRRRRPLPNN